MSNSLLTRIEGGTYNAENEKMNSLVGLIVQSAKIDPDKGFVLLETSDGPRYLAWVGDCCAHCYLAAVSGMGNLIGETILEIENAEWVSNNNKEMEVVEKMGTKIKTSKGYVTFESRVEHNGYYGGEITVSKKAPIDQYSCYCNSPIDLVELKDF